MDGGGEGGTLPCFTRGGFVRAIGAGFLLLAPKIIDFIGLIMHWILMALDCFLNVSLCESYELWQGGERERKGSKAGCREAGWSVAGAHGGGEKRCEREVESEGNLVETEIEKKRTETGRYGGR